MTRLLTHAIALCCIMIASCKKPDEIPATVTYTFKNVTGTQISLDVYSSRNDYNTNANVLEKHVIRPDSAIHLPFQPGAVYWIDWYSANYSLNNWSSAMVSYLQPGFSPPPELRIAADDDYFNISANGDTARSVLLNGTEIMSTWEAVLKHTRQSDGTHRFVFRKDFTGLYIYTSPAGVVVKKQISYTVSPKRNYFRLMLYEDSTALAELYYNADPGSYPHFGRDTLMANIRADSYYNYYPAVRQ